MNGPESMELDSSAPHTQIVTIIFLCYGIPSFLLMIFFLFFLGIGKNYKNSFYRLVQLDLLTNILCYLNTWVALRFDKHPVGVRILKSLETTFTGIVSLSQAATACFMHMQFCSAVALNIHRITSVVYFQSHEKSWSRYYPIFGLITVIYSIIPQLTIPGKAVEIKIENGTLVAYWDTGVIDRAMYQTAVFVLIYFLLLLGISIATYHLVSRKIRTFSTNDRGISKKLTKIALTYCSIYTGILFWTIVGALNGPLNFLPTVIIEYRFDILSFTSDMITLAMPYILIIHDANIKRDIKKVFQTPVEVVQVNSASIS